MVVTLSLIGYAFEDVSRRAPVIRPTLRYWRPGSLGATLKPSAQYMLLASATFLGYQVPVILMQRILGPEVVVVYSVTRTVYSTSRRFLNLFTNSVGPEITLIYGQRNWRQLHRVYDFSERIILLMIPPITFGSMLATPLLLWIWLRKEQLYDPSLCILLGLAASIVGIKEHKYIFQFSSNSVAQISYLTIVSYSVMAVVAIPAMMKFGLHGFLVTWLACETFQLFYLLRLNDRLFGREAILDHRSVYKMLPMLIVGTVALWSPMYHITSLSFLLQGVAAVLVTLITAGLSYWVFRIDEVRHLVWKRIARRLPALTTRQS